MGRKLLFAVLGCALCFVGLAPSAHSATTTALLISQSDAFKVLGHSCGGIQEQAFATGFDATSGYPTGDVYLQTRCGGSGRGGGYTTTTYSAWVAVTWDFTGATVSYARLSSAPNVDPSFSAFDGSGNEVYNVLSAVNVLPANCTVGNTSYCTYRAYLTLAPGYVPVPRVTGVSTSAGPSSGGTTVNIAGDAFTGATAVSFGGVPAASFTVTSDTTITAVSPLSSAGTVDISVTSPGGVSAPNASDQFTFVAAPTVTNVSPSSGPIAGGTSVAITGTGLTGATAVSFGGSPAGFTVNSDTSITAISPAVEAADTTDVTVTTIGGTSATSAADQFTYTTAAQCPSACVSVGDVTMLEGDTGAHNMAFPVTLSAPANTQVTVQYAVIGITATGGSSAGPGIDFKTKTGTVTFSPSTTTGVTPISKYISVPVYGDTGAEPDETFSVMLMNPTGGYVLGKGGGTGTIVNDDGIASGMTMGVGDASVVGANAGSQSLQLPVTLSAPAPSTITVDYTIDPDTAAYSSTKAGGGDYGGKTSGTLTFLTGTSMKTLTVPIWPDANPDTDESFTITLSNATGPIAVIRDTGTGTIYGS